MAVTVPVVIDRSSPVPLYHQLAEQLTDAIESGLLKPGDPFENELALAERLSLSRPTVRRAIGELVQRGLLVRRRGIGTTVASEVIHRRDELTSLFEDLVRSGRTPRTQLLTFDRHAQDATAAQFFGVPPDTELVHVERLRFSGEVPLSVLNNWLLPATTTFDERELETRALYDLMRGVGVRPVVAKQRIGARRPTGAERKLLRVGRSEPLLTMVREAYDDRGHPVEFGDHVYRADQYTFDITVHES
ncbi:GntR family transcriptional regulator [Calidifontibacter sp. DB0510]|uniref:GntR family transcriptional regulator n=1 Tax=Metallococcus carri TaxID=1656884 RepID=A0A967EBC0_9MICO|nr:GntR family transcriptional regulator [Metallococcus carri]NHN57150.1 GntR family transcriptional regulator [Metallococcus carri]NOP38047.1 GntR family transcriptional regulator [Calidifontibacter sp. DB2511S]